MDAHKLLRVLKDLQKDEAELLISKRLDDIRADVAKNNQDGFVGAKNGYDQLVGLIRERSVAWRFTQTEINLLKQVRGERLFGAGLAVQLELLFSSPSFELIANLDQLRSSRNDFLKRAERLVNDFVDVGIEEYRPAESEIGVIIPVEEGNLDSFGRRIDELKLLLTSLAEATDEDLSKVKISRLDNGSYEIFSLQTLQVAAALSTILLNAKQVWDKVTKLRQRIDDTNNDKLLSEEVKGEITKALNKEVANVKKELLSELPDRVVDQIIAKTKEKGSKNEIRNKIRACIKIVTVWFELGIELEVTPVRLNTSNAEGEQPPESKELAVIEQANLATREIYALPKERRLLPFKLEDEADPDPEAS